jgi:hypothetical protein
MKRILLVVAGICTGLQMQANTPETTNFALAPSVNIVGEVDLFVAEVVTKEFNDVLNIDIETQSEQIITVEVFDADDQVVFSDRLSLYGTMFKKIYTEDYPSGTYKILITCEDQVLEEQVVKK